MVSLPHDDTMLTPENTTEALTHTEKHLEREPTTPSGASPTVFTSEITNQADAKAILALKAELVELKVEYSTVMTTQGQAGGQKNSKDSKISWVVARRLPTTDVWQAAPETQVLARQQGLTLLKEAVDVGCKEDYYWTTQDIG